MAAELLNHASGREARADGVLAELIAALAGVVDAHYDARRNLLDYGALRDSRAFRRLCAAVNDLAGTQPASLDSDAERLALWLNVYNALVIHAVVARGITTSVRRSEGFFEGPHYCIGGNAATLDVIEHGLLRHNRRKYLALFPVLGKGDPRLAWAPRRLEPRVHFGLYTAARSSPPLEVFRPERVTEQLVEATRSYLEATVRLDPERRELTLPAAFRWYTADFGDEVTELLRFIADHARDDATRERLRGPAREWEIRFADYDWRLNDRFDRTLTAAAQVGGL